MAHPPDVDLPDGVGQWLEWLRHEAQRDLTLPRRGPSAHRHWDHLYTPETREVAAIGVLMYGQEGEALDLRRRAWTKSESGNWTLSETTLAWAHEEGFLVSEIDDLLGPDGALHMPSDWVGGPEPARSMEVRVDVEGEEPWVSFAELAAFIEGSGSGSKGVR